MTCGLCHRPPRQDDGLSTVQFESNTAHYATWGDLPPGTVTCAACSECRAILDGIEHIPIVYPAGRPDIVPNRAGASGINPIDVCGICRRACRQGDHGRPIRITSQEHPSQEEGGVYLACAECLEILKPVVLERLKAQGLVPQHVTVQTVARDMLL